MPSAIAEDYLKTIYAIRRDRGTSRVRTSELAEELEVTQPTVTSIVSRLADRGLLDHEKYKGVRLTEEGEQCALRVRRNYRVLETYLTNELRCESVDAAAEADRLEHHVSDEFVQCLEEVLEVDDPSIRTCGVDETS